MCPKILTTQLPPAQIKQQFLLWVQVKAHKKPSVQQRCDTLMPFNQHYTVKELLKIKENAQRISYLVLIQKKYKHLKK